MHFYIEVLPYPLNINLHINSYIKTFRNEQKYYINQMCNRKGLIYFLTKNLTKILWKGLQAN